MMSIIRKEECIMRVVNTFEELVQRLEGSKLIIFEGYEMMGKSHVINWYLHQSTDSVVFRPDYESIDYDKLINRNDRYIIGLSVLDFYRSINPSTQLIFDRGILSSIVYNKFYGNTTKNMDSVVTEYLRIVKDLNGTIVLLDNRSKALAKMRYDLATERGEHTDKYDQFLDFDDYWKKMNEFQDSFISELDKLDPSSVNKIIYKGVG